MEDALRLEGAELQALTACAFRVKKQFFGDSFDLCAVKGIKEGHCSEDCKYCSQSAHYHGGAAVLPFVEFEAVQRAAESLAPTSVQRLCLVSCGKRMSDAEVDRICSYVQRIHGIDCCTSIGLSTRRQLERLKAAGVKRIHNNLETSRSFFPRVCTTHTYDEKVEVIRNAKELGLEVCSGGLFGLGEQFRDRVELALTVRELEVDSIPINVLNPIPGTPYEQQSVLTEEELLRIIAVFRLMLPDREIRLCGRSVLKDHGFAAFGAGISSAITGQLITVSGIGYEDDLKTIAAWGGFVQKACSRT